MFQGVVLGAADQERAERAAAADANAVRQELGCEEYGQQQAGGLCEACGYRRRTEAPIVAAVNDLAGLGTCHDPTVTLSIGTDYLLAAIREAPVTLDPAARDRAAAPIRRDHVFHSNRHRTRE
ncbi:hypothetical protein [Streptomyces sp. NPDC092903]|uniref:hypothetical protein n=1 Tax=Streptomyces sp. NPDC092903 TaxID=3366017 RepID=UPI00382F2521